MSDIASVTKHLGKVVGAEVTEISTYFTTDGSGVPTLGISHGDLISILQETNLYTLTFPIGSNMSVQLTYDNASLSHALTLDESIGQVAIQFSGAFNNKRCDVKVTYHDSEVN